MTDQLQIPRKLTKSHISSDNPIQSPKLELTLRAVHVIVQCKRVRTHIPDVGKKIASVDVKTKGETHHCRDIAILGCCCATMTMNPASSRHGEVEASYLEV